MMVAMEGRALSWFKKEGIQHSIFILGGVHVGFPCKTPRIEDLINPEAVNKKSLREFLSPFIFLSMKFRSGMRVQLI